MSDKKFRFTAGNIISTISSLVKQMDAEQKKSVKLTEFNGLIRLPGGGFIGSNHGTVSLSSNGNLIITRSDRTNDSGHEYSLDDITIQWIKTNKIPIHKI